MLSRELRENAKRSYELAVAITGALENLENWVPLPLHPLHIDGLVIPWSINNWFKALQTIIIIIGIGEDFQLGEFRDFFKAFSWSSRISPAFTQRFRSISVVKSPCTSWSHLDEVPLRKWPFNFVSCPGPRYETKRRHALQKDCDEMHLKIFESFEHSFGDFRLESHVCL